MKKNVISLMVLLFLALYINAQEKEAENTYAITGKSKRGTLADVKYDGSQYLLTYVTKSTGTKIHLQEYYFDIDFKFIKMEEDELEIQKAKEKYTWVNYNGDLYTVEGNTVEANLTGTLVLKKKRITYKYDWLLLGYNKTVEILNKVKPKTDDGRKFFYYTHAEDDNTGDIYVLCGIKANMQDVKKDKKLAYKHNLDMVVLKFNSDLEIVKEVPISFDYPNQNIFARTIFNNSDDSTAPSVGGMSFVFAPVGGPGLNKYADPNNCNYRYIGIDNELNIKNDIKFESNASYWKIDDQIIDVSTGETFLYGPLAEGKDKYYNMSLNTTKFKAVQLMKINNGKMEYLTQTNLDEFKSKLKTPPSQKKAPAYDGKHFEIAAYKLAANGDLLVLGQNKDDKGYKDVIAFHFDDKGHLKAQYGLDILENNNLTKANPAAQMLLNSNDGKSLYWLLLEIRGTTTWSSKPLMYPRIGKIDLDNANITDFQSFGTIGKDKYYLDPKVPFLETNEGGKIVFFGSDKAGKNLWFCRVKLN